MEQRIIKFRKWVGDEMLYSKPFHLVAPGDSLHGRNDYMQYVGFGDALNKDIYEMDIVECVGELLRATTNHYCQPQPKSGDKYVVVCLESGYMLRPVDLFKALLNCTAPNLSRQVDNYDFWNGHRGLKVIGNIYEHPNLLP